MDINWKSETKYFWDIFVYLKISPIFVNPLLIMQMLDSLSLSFHLLNYFI